MLQVITIIYEAFMRFILASQWLLFWNAYSAFPLPQVICNIRSIAVSLQRLVQVNGFYREEIINTY